MRVNKEVHVRLQQGADDDIELQYNGAAEGKCCDPDCDDSRLSAIVIAKCCSVCVLTAHCVLLLV